MNTPLRGKVGSLLNLHLAGVVLLIGLNLFLVVRLFFAWHAVSSDREEQIAQAQVTYAQLESQTRRLGNLPGKVADARTQAAQFYADRIPPNYSTIAANIGEMYQHAGVRWTGASYTQTPAIADLVEIRIDARVSGEYTSVVRFINAVERDKTFFVIDGLTLTGQQGGLVNLRLKLTTYLHAADAAQVPPAGDTAIGPLSSGPVTQNTGGLVVQPEPPAGGGH